MGRIDTQSAPSGLRLLLASIAASILLAIVAAHAASAATTDAKEAGRVALVIGNAAYPGAAALRNPVNDANDIAGKLRALGFDVMLRTDVPLRQMLRSLSEFGDRIGDGSEALFFYAGHGMQVNGRNYLIPIDAEIRAETHVSSEAVDVDQLLDKLAHARLSLVILDACRNNPFERRFRGGGQGLAQINAPTGTLIAYATAPGKVAADGDGRNGLYTQELLKAIDVPGIKVEDVFKRVRANVIQSSGDAQTPWESSSLTGDFYFNRQASAHMNAPASPTDPETEVWQAAQQTHTGAAYARYLDAYPNGRYALAARIRLDATKARVPSPPTSAATVTSMPATPSGNTASAAVGTVFKDCAACPEMVVIPGGIAIGRTEVTQGQWRALLGSAPSRFPNCGDDCPVDQISWNDAQEYLRILSMQSGKIYRLPSEEEWERACLAGSQHDYCGGNEIDGVAWFDGNSGERTRPVAGKQANAWGLYDMSGNVWEWTNSCWENNCALRVMRGGSVAQAPRNVTATVRVGNVVSARQGARGFRPVRMFP